MPYSGALSVAPNDVAFSLDGSLIYAPGRWTSSALPVPVNDGNLRIYNSASGVLVNTIALGTRLGAIDISPDGSFALVVELEPLASGGGGVTTTVYKVDLTTFATSSYPFTTSSSSNPFYDVAILANGTAILTQGNVGSTTAPIAVLNLATGTYTSGPGVYQPSYISGGSDHSEVLIGQGAVGDAPLAIYRDNLLVADHGLYADGVMGGNRGIQAYNSATGLVAQYLGQNDLHIYDGRLHYQVDLADLNPTLFSNGVGATGLAFDASGQYLFVLDAQSNRILEFSTQNWALVRTIQSDFDFDGSIGNFGNALSLAPDGSFVIAGYRVSDVYSGTVEIAVPADFATVDGGTNPDTLTGTSGTDVIDGHDGNDAVSGLAGNDLLFGGAGNDVLDGADGDDVLVAGAGDDVLTGGAGIDTANYFGATTGVRIDLGLSTPQDTLGDGMDTLSGVENILGTRFADVLLGDTGANRIAGNAGDDTLSGGAGNDRLWGGAGNYTADYSQETGGGGILVNLSLSTFGTAQGEVRPNQVIDTYGNVDDLSSIETVITGSTQDSLYGGAGNETFRSGAGDDFLSGGAGADVLDGGEGADRLAGGASVDSLTGGSGNDRFRDTSAGLDGDTITDLAVGEKIIVSDATFADFTYSLSGNTLSYSGGSLTLSVIPVGHLVARADAIGVSLSFVSATVQNDFNGDGRSDVLWRNATGAFSDWLGQPNGALIGNDGHAFANIPVSWKVAGTGDFNGDGRADVLWRNDNGQLSDWLGQANGGFAQNDANAFTQVPTSWKVVGAGDFNGDGRSDILWRNDNGQLSDWLGQSNGGFAQNDANALTQVPTSWRVVGTGDFNGDGRGDILWRNDNGQLSDWLGQANGGFAGNDANAFTQAPTSWKVVGSGDFNGDGRSDILWRNDSGALSDWLGQANGGFVGNDANAYSAVPTSWHVADVGDYNGDGRDDILWRNSSGALSDWLGQANGGFVGNDASALTSAPTTWLVQSPDSLYL